MGADPTPDVGRLRWRGASPRTLGWSPLAQRAVDRSSLGAALVLLSGPTHGSARIRHVRTEVAAANGGTEVCAEWWVACGDLHERCLDALGDREPRALPVRGCSASSVALGKLSDERAELSPELLSASEIVQTIRLLEVFA